MVTLNPSKKSQKNHLKFNNTNLVLNHKGNNFMTGQRVNAGFGQRMGPNYGEQFVPGQRVGPFGKKTENALYS